MTSKDLQPHLDECVRESIYILNGDITFPFLGTTNCLWVTINTDTVKMSPPCKFCGAAAHTHSLLWVQISASALIWPGFPVQVSKSWNKLEDKTCKKEFARALLQLSAMKISSGSYKKVQHQRRACLLPVRPKGKKTPAHQTTGGQHKKKEARQTESSDQTDLNMQLFYPHVKTVLYMQRWAWQWLKMIMFCFQAAV